MPKNSKLKNVPGSARETPVEDSKSQGAKTTGAKSQGTKSRGAKMTGAKSQVTKSQRASLPLTSSLSLSIRSVSTLTRLSVIRC